MQSLVNNINELGNQKPVYDENEDDDYCDENQVAGEVAGIPRGKQLGKLHNVFKFEVIFASFSSYQIADGNS